MTTSYAQLIAMTDAALLEYRGIVFEAVLETNDPDGTLEARKALVDALLADRKAQARKAKNQ